MSVECPFGGLTQLGPYQISHVIGRGGMGAVYRARHRDLKREVALKVLTGDLDEDDTLLARFRREAETAAHLAHPGLVKVFDLDRDQGLHYIAMELVSGPTLAHVIQSGVKTSVLEITRIVREILEALGALHGAGVLHRDLKPANVMLEGGKRVRVLDLGLVRVQHRTLLTGDGYRVGSPRYMAPELIVDGTCDPRTDLWQVGLVAYELITGRPAYPESHVPKLLENIVREPPPPVPALAGAAGERLRATVTALLQHVAARRTPTCADALAMLEPRASARAARPSVGAVGAPARRGIALATGAAAVLAVGLGAVVWLGRAPAVSVPSAVASPRPDRAELVRRVLEGVGATVRKTTFDELRSDVARFRKGDRTAAERWTRRLPELIGNAGLLRELAAVRGQLVPADVAVDVWAAYLRRMHELAELGGDLRQMGVESGLSAGELLDGALAASRLAPAGARGVAAVVFGEHGPAAPSAVTTRASGPAVFAPDISGSLSLAVRDDFKQPDFAFPTAPRRAWLHWRCAAGTPGERLQVRVVDAERRGGLEIAFVGAAAGEWWVPVDPRALRGPALLRLTHENRSTSYVPVGIALDFVELVIAP